MAQNKALSLRVQWLGDRLRRAREAAGYTLEEAGEYLQVRHATLSRFENGIYRPRPSYVRDLVDFYGISNDNERAVLLQLNEDAWRKDWWDGGSNGFDMAFADYTWLESRAIGLYIYEPLLIHGLLQTPEYIMALIKAGRGAGADDRSAKATVENRLARQCILDRKNPPRVSVIVEESALRRRIGSPAVHRDQLAHILELGAKRHIDIRLIGMESGWHDGLDGAFTLVDLPDPYPDVVYIEGLTGRSFMEEDDKVRRYQEAYDGLRRTAFKPRASVQAIQKILKDID